MKNKVKVGVTVTVKLQPEPDNPFASKATSIMTHMEEKWERIGYIVKGGPDDAHEAISNHQTK